MPVVEVPCYCWHVTSQWPASSWKYLSWLGSENHFSPPVPLCQAPPLHSYTASVTCLPCDDHWLKNEPEELIQDLMEEEHERLQAGRRQRDDAQLQLMLQLALWDLLIPHADGEWRSALQSMAKSEKALQVVVLETRDRGVGKGEDFKLSFSNDPPIR